MSAPYWNILGAKVAKGAAERTLRHLGVGGKLLGRASAAVGIGFLAYELVKNYKDNIESEPAYREMMALQVELEKWTGAIACLGREPLEDQEFGFFADGGAINALHRKTSCQGRRIEDADPQEAYAMIGRAMNCIRRTTHPLGDDRFEAQKKELVARLRELQLQIRQADDYRPIQEELGAIVDTIRPIAAGYSCRVYDCRCEVKKRVGSNALWAAVSMTTLGLLKKPFAGRA